MDDKKWRVTSTENVYHNPWFSVRRDSVVRPDGRLGEFNTVESPASVSIVVVSDKSEVSFVRLYRPSIKAYSWELPGGAIDVGEDPLTAAKRELKEETGLAANTWLELGKIQTATGFVEKPTYGFIAKDITTVGGDERLEEGITDVKTLPWQEVKAMLLNERIVDAPTIATLYKYHLMDQSGTL